MSELKPRITENGIDYILVGDYYIPGLKLPEERHHPGHEPQVHDGPDGRHAGPGGGHAEQHRHHDQDDHHHGADENCRGRNRGIEAYPPNGMGAALQ